MCGCLTNLNRYWWRSDTIDWVPCCCLLPMPGCDAEQGRVDIAVEVVSGECCRPSSWKESAQACMARIAVSDSGGDEFGRPGADVRAVFSTKETHAGLGLTLVYGIVRQYGGTVEVQSQPGQGTTVRLYLPLVERNGVVRDTRVRREAVSKGAETVLVVEEDEIARKLALSTLHSIIIRY